METIELQIPHLIRIGDLALPYQYSTIFMSILVSFLLVLLAVVCTRGLKLIPGRGQALMELTVSAFRDLVNSTMGPKDGRTYLPLIGTIFLWVWTSNMIGLIPTADIFHMLTGEPYLHFEVFGAEVIIPGFEEPTRNVNTPWALGIMVFFIMHIAAVARKGPAKYCDEYFTPHLGTFIWHNENPALRTLGAVVFAAVWAALAWLIAQFFLAGQTLWIVVGAVGAASLIWCLVRLSHEPRKVGVPNVLMFPLNVIGKFAEILSMSFRLFGNIFGGAIIIALLGGMTSYIALPILLQGFMGIFVGTIQAFVFAMLALVYITVEIQEEDEAEAAVEEAMPHTKAAKG